MRVLGIETSCDETAIGIVEDGRTILSNVVASSEQFHALYGGVVPEIAARVHVEVIWSVLEESLKQADCQLRGIDAVGVTQGPGLPGALLIGLSFAKGLALALDRPLVGVDHLAAHLYAGEMVEQSVEPPYIGLVVSGGHTLLCVVHPDQRYEILGETKDDAVGEAFDKVARLLGLGYPGGPIIDRLSDEGNRAAIPFPRHTAKETLNFSFSGLKTAVYHYVQKLVSSSAVSGQERSSLTTDERAADERGGHVSRAQIVDIAASFQETAVEILIGKTLRACQRTGMQQIVVGGGVAANRRLRQRLTEEGQEKQYTVVFPPVKLCADNGAMIGGLAYRLLRRGKQSSLAINAEPGLQLAGAAIS